MPELPHPVFVYVTLKRGEVRARMWPSEPIAVELAEVRGALFDLGPYPALVAGEGRVAGELWRFVEEDLAATLVKLDRIEGYRGQPDDWYRREVIESHTTNGRHWAWTYLFAHPEDLATARLVLAGADGLCRWSNPTAPWDEN